MRPPLVVRHGSLDRAVVKKQVRDDPAARGSCHFPRACAASAGRAWGTGQGIVRHRRQCAAPANEVGQSEIDAAARCSGLSHPSVAPNSGKPPEGRHVLLPCGPWAIQGLQQPLPWPRRMRSKPPVKLTERDREIRNACRPRRSQPVGRRDEGSGGLRNCKIANVCTTLRGRANRV